MLTNVDHTLKFWQMMNFWWHFDQKWTHFWQINLKSNSNRDNKIDINTDIDSLTDFVLPEDDWDLESNSSGSSTYSDEGEDRTFAQDADFDNEYTEAMHKELLTTNVPHTSLDANRKVNIAAVYICISNVSLVHHYDINYHYNFNY